MAAAKGDAMRAALSHLVSHALHERRELGMLREGALYGLVEPRMTRGVIDVEREEAEVENDVNRSFRLRFLIAYAPSVNLFNEAVAFERAHRGKCVVGTVRVFEVAKGVFEVRA